MTWVYDDGGRKAAGYSEKRGDCVTRAIAIATGLPYQVVFDGLKAEAERERPRLRWHKGEQGRKEFTRRKSSVSHGVKPATTRRYLDKLGWEFVPCMAVGTGCKVHLRKSELPKGRLIIRCSLHLTAVIDGVIHDTYDPSRQGTRCVYGYWRKR